MNRTIIRILGGLISTFFSYSVDRRQKIDEVLLIKKIELAQKLSVLLQKVHTKYCEIETLWDCAFPNVDFDEAINAFDRCSIYDEDRERINDAQANILELRELHFESAILFSRKFQALLAHYLDFYQFTYKHTELGFSSTLSECFFKNLKTTSKQRSALYAKLKKEISKLAK